jgi:putative ABC transport system substrate-binding protein
VNRRDFLAAIAGLTAWPLTVHAQQPAVPVVGFFRSTASEPFADIVAAFGEGLRDAGFTEGQNVTVEYRWANNKLERLPDLAADLVRRQVSVIVGNSLAVEAARAQTTSIPIVFVVADDPVKSGYVDSLSRPGGNLTGITFYGGGQLAAKRVELLHELVPTADVIAVLQDPNYPGFKTELANVEAAISGLGLRMLLVNAARTTEFDSAFAAIASSGAGALLVGGSPLFTSKRREVVKLAAEHTIPAIYDQRAHVVAGGLMSYGASFVGAYRQAGVYAGRILKGDKPSELPVLRPTTFELVVNLKTARSLGLNLPDSILVRADEVIE